MASQQIYAKRASAFSTWSWTALSAPPYMADVDGYRAPDLIERVPAIIEHRTNGYKFGVGYSSRDALRDFANRLRIDCFTLGVFDRRYERTEQRLWLQYEVDGRARLFAVVGNTWPADVPASRAYWYGGSTLPHAWPALCALAKEADVETFVVEMRRGVVSATDERRLRAAILLPARPAAGRRQL